MPPEPLVRVDGLMKRFGTGAPVFADVYFRIAEGEFVCLIGHSGCGKTTILNVLAGLDEASDGTVLFAGRELDGPSLDRAVIFQGHALLPWLDVEANVAFAVRSRWPRWSNEQVRAHVAEQLGVVGLGQAAKKKPSALSGGMRQRVGIARALAIRPRMLLMDEPFSALDALTRGTLQDEVARLCAETRQTVFMITHDVDEALLLADRIFLMTNGPDARIAEIVVNTIPGPRRRHDVHHHPAYPALRNHLLDFLIERSRGFGVGAADYDPKNPPEIRLEAAA
ncbi:MAG: nitrate/sulfonate/bicarbonate transporter ATP-binding protein [Rhodospirillales bacterium]|nr:nitrate/sulfonate/bicarbonate transporter ATP-binding protein [Rhodospirillales bacterium]